MAEISKPPVYRISAAQLAVLLLIWAGLTSWNSTVASSFGLGGLVAIIPHAWFATGVFRRRGASAVRQVVAASYAAETGKFLLTVAGFALVFATVRPVEGWAVFAGYIVMLVIQLIGAWRLVRTSRTGAR